jgi:glycine/D-amino acid oxidase-like deaminating enzyme
MEVAVVGGGIIGCAAAAFLAEGGARVTLFEARELGVAASGRNSGSVQHPFEPILADLHRATLDQYRELKPHGFALPDAPAGLLLLTDDGGAARERAADLAASYPELRPRLLDGRALADAEPILAPGLTAIRLETGYPVPPDAALRAYAARARAAGASLDESRAVSGLLIDARAVRGVVVREGESIAADAVLVAAGPWTAELLDPTGGWQPIVRTWGVTVQVSTRVSPRHILEEGVVHTVNRTVTEPGTEAHPAVPSVFSMISVDGVSTVGSTFLPREPDPVAVAPLLVERGARLVPSLRAARPLRQRACARPQSLDGRPLVGRPDGLDGVVVVAGHGPWGISTGPATARMAVDLLLGARPAIPPELDPNRFGPLPL